MIKKLLLAVLFVMVFPFFFVSQSSQQSLQSSVVIAGHAATGGWCECGSSVACICDPGEIPPGGLTVQEDEETVSNDEDAPLADPGLIALAFLTAFFFWNRIRA